MTLLEQVRQFWYDNHTGDFSVWGIPVARREIQRHGGPAPELAECPTCQKREWLSRVCRSPRYDYVTAHACAVGDRARFLVECQGDEFWTHYNQNFWYMLGCDPKLNAPKCALLIPPRPNSSLHWFLKQNCDQWGINLRRGLAQACQVDAFTDPAKIDWAKYDFLFLKNTGPDVPDFGRPDLPIVMYCQDGWFKDYQTPIDRLKPDYVLTPYLTAWKETLGVKWPAHTEFYFYGTSPSTFFARPNLDPEKKSLDLITVGVSNPAHVYKPRQKLDRQLKRLPAKYKVGYSHRGGSRRDRWSGSTVCKGDRRFLNKWSELLGTARYATFGPLKGDFPGGQLLITKHYELLGSGAIPILPDAPDLHLLDIEPHVHYIPLSKVWRNNNKLMWYLDRYEKHRHIAANAVRWYQENADRTLFDDFEDFIRDVTEHRYPKRLL